MAKAKIAGKLTTVNQHELQDSGLDMLRLALFNEITPREGTSGIDNNLVYMESRHADMPETAQIDAVGWPLDTIVHPFALSILNHSKSRKREMLQVVYMMSDRKDAHWPDEETEFSLLNSQFISPCFCRTFVVCPTCLIAHDEAQTIPTNSFPSTD